MELPVTHELSFAKIIILREDIAEVQINDGVEMNIGMVEEYHRFLHDNLSKPFSLLVNKVNVYTYDFQAQMKIGTLNDINAMAVVVYNRMTEATTEGLKSLPRGVKWNLKMFYSRDQALLWLGEEQGKLSK